MQQAQGVGPVVVPGPDPGRQEEPVTPDPDPTPGRKSAPGRLPATAPPPQAQGLCPPCPGRATQSSVTPRACDEDVPGLGWTRLGIREAAVPWAQSRSGSSSETHRPRGGQGFSLPPPPLSTEGRGPAAAPTRSAQAGGDAHLAGNLGPPLGWLTLSLLQEGLHGCCTGRSERNPGRREGHPLWVGVTGKIRDCPVLLPHPGGGHWVTPSLMQCTRGGLLPAAGRAPWEGRGGCRGTGWAGPPQLSCLATPRSAHSPLLAAGACWVMRAERGESRRAGQLGSPGISYNEGTEAPTLRAHVHCILGELPCAHLPGLLCLGDICDASSQL